MPKTRPAARKEAPALPSLTELRSRYVTEGQALPKTLERRLREDPRAGVRKILEAVEKRRRDNRAEGQRLRRLKRYEQPLWRELGARVAGVDEAGMSPLAGPVVAAAVILQEGAHLPQVDDSKKLSPAQRYALADVIREQAVSYGIGMASPEEIDTINIYHAGLLAMRRAVLALRPSPAHLLVDARTVPDWATPQTAIVKGDQKSLSIAAASILAKTARDTLMAELDGQYPGYGFAVHKGYPVAAHVAALHALGPCPMHRRSFRPVRDAMEARAVR